jgi:hypothetical protein
MTPTPPTLVDKPTDGPPTDLSPPESRTPDPPATTNDLPTRPSKDIILPKRRNKWAAAAITKKVARHDPVAIATRPPIPLFLWHGMTAHVWQIPGPTSIACLNHIKDVVANINVRDDGSTVDESDPEYITPNFKFVHGQPNKPSFYDNQAKITYADSSMCPENMTKLINALCDRGYETHWASTHQIVDKTNWVKAIYTLIDRPGGSAIDMPASTVFPPKSEVRDFAAKFFHKHDLELNEIIGELVAPKSSTSGATNNFFAFGSPTQAVAALAIGAVDIVVNASTGSCVIRFNFEPFQKVLPSLGPFTLALGDVYSIQDDYLIYEAGKALETFNKTVRDPSTPLAYIVAADKTPTRPDWFRLTVSSYEAAQYFLHNVKSRYVPENAEGTYKDVISVNDGGVLTATQRQRQQFKDFGNKQNEGLESQKATNARLDKIQTSLETTQDALLTIAEYTNAAADYNTRTHTYILDKNSNDNQLMRLDNNINRADEQVDDYEENAMFWQALRQKTLDANPDADVTMYDMFIARQEKKATTKTTLLNKLKADLTVVEEKGRAIEQSRPAPLKRLTLGNVFQRSQIAPPSDYASQRFITDAPTVDSRFEIITEDPMTSKIHSSPPAPLPHTHNLATNPVQVTSESAAIGDTSKPHTPPPPYPSTPLPHTHTLASAATTPAQVPSEPTAASDTIPGMDGDIHMNASDPASNTPSRSTTPKPSDHRARVDDDMELEDVPNPSSAVSEAGTHLTELTEFSDDDQPLSPVPIPIPGGGPYTPVSASVSRYI